MILDRPLRAGVMAVKSTGYAWIVLACGVAFSLVLLFVVQARIDSLAKLRFESDVRDAGSQIENRMQDYADVLFGVRALFQSTGAISRRDFHHYVDSLDLGARYPGFQTLNFAQYVTAEHKAAFEESIRGDRSLNGRGYPEFRVLPPGQRPAYYVLTYVEPMEGNEGVFGNDIAMNNYPAVLRVLERARDTNALLSSGRLVQIQGTDRHVGLTMRLPVYRTGWPIETVEQRRLAYIGSVGAGFRVRESLDPIIATATQKPIEFTLYNIGPAGTAATPDRLVEGNFLYSSHAGKPGATDASIPERGVDLSSIQGFQFGGRQLAIHFSASRTAYIDSIARLAGVFVLSGGLIITLLLSALVYSLGRSRHEAQLLAAEMTSELQESKAFLTEAQRMARIGSWMLYVDGRMQWSEETCRILNIGANPAEATLDNFLGFIYPDDREALHALLRHCFKHHERQEFDHRLLMPGGAMLWIHTIIEGTLARDQCIVRGTSKDITERTLAEVRLRASEARYRNLVETSHDLIWSWDANGCYSFLNRAWEPILGYASEEMLGRPYSDFVAPATAAQTREEFARRLSSGPVVGCEIVHISKSGAEVVLLFNATPVRDGEMRVVGAQGAASDVTQRRRFERELMDARDAAHASTRAKSQFLANMSHEIRTPMTGILGMAELLQATGLTRQQSEYVAMVQSSGEHLLTIINEILDFSKIEANGIEINPANFILRHEITRILQPQLFRARHKGLRVGISFASDLPHSVHGDAARLGQVLVNLLDNAIKFTSRGDIEVSLDAEPDQDTQASTCALHCSVRDCGIGIGPDKIDGIFEAFSQADGSISRQYGGTGLGLTISQQLVQRMGGRIWVDSALGKGSTFHFTVLLGKSAGLPASCSGVTDAQPAGQRALRLLLAEDTPVNQVYAVATLTKAGHAVTVANNGEEAVRLAGAQTFDAILMDVQMPVVDGFTATRRLRERGMTLPIIALTAHAMKGFREECLKNGMDDYLSKPFHCEDLLAKLQKLGIVAASGDAPDAPEGGLPLPEPVSAEPDPAIPAAPESAGSDVLDIASALKTAGGDHDLLKTMMGMVAKQIDEDMPTLRALAGSGTRSEVKNAAHRLKGSLAAISARNAHAACLGLETFAQDNRTSEYAQAMRHLDAQIGVAQRAIRNLLGT